MEVEALAAIGVAVTWALAGLAADRLTTWRFIGGGYLHDGNAFPAWAFRRFGMARGFVVTDTAAFLLLAPYALLCLWFGMLAPLLVCLDLLGLSGCIASLWNTLGFVRKRRRMAPVLTILAVAGGQQAWVYSFIWPLPASSPGASPEG